MRKERTREGGISFNWKVLELMSFVLEVGFEAKTDESSDSVVRDHLLGCSSFF